MDGFDRSIGRRVRAAVVQAAPVAFDREATLDRVARWTAKAATQGAELVVFPEAFVSGYPKGADFGAVVGSRSAEGREWFRRDHDSGVDVPGPAVGRSASPRAHRRPSLYSEHPSRGRCRPSCR